MTTLASPLLDPANSLLDERQRAVVQRVSDAERAHILALPSNDPLDAKLRFRVEATGPELFGQPAAIRATLQLNATTLDAIADRLAGGVSRVVLVGGGDSLAVMVAARHALESMLGVAVRTRAEPGVRLLPAASVADSARSVIALSSSGETTRTVRSAARRPSIAARIPSRSPTPPARRYRPRRAIALEIEATRVGWPTQSSTAALALLLELAIRVGERRVPWRGRRAACGARRVARHDDRRAGPDRPGAGRHRRARGRRGRAARAVLRRRPNLATAIVGAAKVKECTTLTTRPRSRWRSTTTTTRRRRANRCSCSPRAGPTVPRAVDTGRDAHAVGRPRCTW